jgi:lipopolysaccharide biosynthesis glycosyltransferase
MSEKEQININNVVFYSTANSGYAIYSAVSLLTIRDVLPGAKLCILSSYLSKYDKKILKSNSIEYRIIDLKQNFTRTWEYPIECYYIFAGPQLFYEEGYKYSVYVDGDTLCKADPLKGISDIGGIASAEQQGSYISIFGNDWDKIRQVWGIPKSVETRKRINSGVVYFNNEKMTQIKLLEKATQLFKKSIENNMPRKGDDSLFALFQYVHMNAEDIIYLPPDYNFVLQFNEWIYPIRGLVFFHFSLDKPWKRRPYKHETAELDMYNPYVKLWRAKYRQIATSAWLKALFVKQ